MPGASSSLGLRPSRSSPTRGEGNCAPALCEAASSRSGEGFAPIPSMEGAGQPWHSLGHGRGDRVFFDEDNAGRRCDLMGGVLAGDDQAAVAEACKDVRARFEQQELSLADLISVDDPDGRQVEQATVAELLKR